MHKFTVGLNRSAAVIDLGCSGIDTLKFLSYMGFMNLRGVDLNVTLIDRIMQLVHWKRLKFARLPFRLKHGDLMQTHFPAGSYDLATCISVLEHGVDTERFLTETARLLKPDGRLFVTADYWEIPIDTSDVADQFHLPWKVLSRSDIEQILQIAQQKGLNLLNDSDIPSCAEPCVAWNGKEFTFIALGFVKSI
ncbi:MAG: class I SAM-dependent methyltransferase [Sedimentisphaerales bacterium]|nr:class I SAM-dependent methyltransferase [Sedimentisphaerales bacterium]